MSNRQNHFKTKHSNSYNSQNSFLLAADIREPTPARWVCHHRMEGSEIEAFVPRLESIEVIATAHHLNGVDARANAEIIVKAVNEYEKYAGLMRRALKNLEKCLDDGILPLNLRQEIMDECRDLQRMLLGAR